MATSNKSVNSRKKWSIYTIFGLLADILFYPIIIISLIACFATLADRQQGKMPSVLGVSFGCVSSSSMTRSGFNVGDIVITTTANPYNLRTGDIITFYYYHDSADKNYTESSLTLIQSYDRTKALENDFSSDCASEYNQALLNEICLNSQGETSQRKQIQDLPSSVKVYFHRIVAVYSNDKGELFFKTQGDSNPSADLNLVSADYVAGKYVNTPPVIRSVLLFMASSTGVLVVVIIPLCILLLFLLFSIIEQISRMCLEKKVLRRELRFDDKDVVNADILKDMEDLMKIKYFAESPPKDKESVFQYLWGDYENGSRLDVQFYKNVKIVASNFEKNPNAYWNFWQFELKKKKKKNQLKQIKGEWAQSHNLKKGETNGKS